MPQVKSITYIHKWKHKQEPHCLKECERTLAGFDELLNAAELHLRHLLRSQILRIPCPNVTQCKSISHDANQMRIKGTESDRHTDREGERDEPRI